MIAGLGLGLGIFVSTAVMSVVRCRFCKKSTLLRVDDASCGSAKSNLLERRTKNMASNVSVFYRNRGGLAITRGDGVYMFDDRGNKYLDCCNNVACVGHSHPTVVRAGCEELSRIQTNTRFLHPTRQRYLEKLLATFPPELDTVFLVNSGSEANDLALRIARQHTLKEDIIVLNHAYHGHTAALIDISPYKWHQATDGKNRHPTTTHVVSCPDMYRGRFRVRRASFVHSLAESRPHRREEREIPRGDGRVSAGSRSEVSEKQPTSLGGSASPSCEHRYCNTIEEASAMYADEIRHIVANYGGKIAAFITESIVGCGGQIELPPGYLAQCYEAVRSVGALCIADEVQTGFGRVGSHFWGFQAHGVVPDIVTLGKPMGNGYPVGAVVCRRELADSFARTGIEYFNTFGGNSVACSIAEAVLDTIHAEDLQRNAARVGAYLKSQLREKIASKYDCVGDIRGLGLFLGVEFIRTDSDKDCSINNNDSADADAKRIEDVVIDVKAGAKVEEKTEKTEAVAEEAEAEAEAEGMSREEQIKPNADLTKFIVCHLLLSDLEEDSGSSPYQEDKSKVVRIIVSSDGPDENVIKIKPPLVFSMEDADVLVSALDRALQAAAAAASATASTVNPVELSC